MDDLKDLNLEGSNEDRMFLRPASFAITARIAMQLGRESISNSLTAILELVKNAYDADAEKVSINFRNLNTDHSILVIDDDGSGMSLQQFTDSWLVIGTDNKTVTQKSKQKRRVLTGEKGLGRLGLDRLCGSTIVQSFLEDEDYGIELEINWKKYENTNAKLESIEHNMYRIPKEVYDPLSGKSLSKSKGTRLILRDLKDDWNDEALQQLRGELALLVSPFSGVNDFRILFSVDTAPNLNGRVVSDDLLNAAEWKVLSTLEYRDGVAYISHSMSSPITEEKFEILNDSLVRNIS